MPSKIESKKDLQAKYLHIESNKNAKEIHSIHNIVYIIQIIIL